MLFYFLHRNDKIFIKNLQILKKLSTSIIKQLLHTMNKIKTAFVAKKKIFKNQLVKQRI